MSKDTHMVKVYQEDWKTLNLYLSILQIDQGQRLSFADVVSKVVQDYVKSIVAEYMKDITRVET